MKTPDGKQFDAGAPNRPLAIAGAAAQAASRQIWRFTVLVARGIGKVIATDKNVTEPVRIISQWLDQNMKCRGGPGNSDETLKACERREAIGGKLEAVGWCYGRPGEYGYQMNWHRCDDKNRVASADVRIGASESKVLLRPSDYRVKSVYRGKTVLPDFRKRDRDYNMYRTRIREGMRNGPNAPPVCAPSPATPGI